MTGEHNVASGLQPTRRQLLTSLGGAVILAATAGSILAGPRRALGAPTDGDGFDALRRKWADVLTGGPVDTSDPRFATAYKNLASGARTSRSRIDRDPDRKRVFTDLRFRDLANPTDTQASWVITSTYGRLAGMAKAWATPGNSYYQNADLLADIVAGLRTACDYGYNAGIAREYSNWWDFEIGAPAQLLNTLTLVYDQVAPSDLADYLAAVDRFVPDPRYNMQPPYTELSTGANRADLSLIVALRGILGKSDAKVAQGRDGLSDIFVYATSGDGLYADGSYIHHDTVAYTGAYGVILLGRVTDLMALLGGSPWQVTDPNRGVFLDAVDRTYAPVMFNNQMMEFVRGRSLSRYGERGHNQGHTVLDRVITLAEGIEGQDSARAARWRAMARGWLDRDSYDNVFAGASITRIALIDRLLADASVTGSPEPVGFTMFSGMARAVHRGPGWALGIAMCSKRVAYYETGSGENIKGFHTGEGTTYLYNDADNSQFDDEFWPTVNMYRLAGTTLNTMPLPNKTGGEWGTAHPKTATFAGGASLDGEVGVVGLDLEGVQAASLVGVQDPLRARKSWFCFDKYVVCLGAGITDVSGYPVETIVENRNLHATGVNALLLDGAAQPTDQGWSVRHQVGWAHLEGVGGYIFPGGDTINALREERTGTWRDVGSSSSGPITRRYLTMWFDHGSNPSGAGYAYLLMPNATPDDTAALAAEPDYQIVANTADAQAVRIPDDGLTAVNFFAAGSVPLGPNAARGAAPIVTVSAPCSLLVRRHGTELVLAVSDPTQGLSSLTVTLNLTGYHLDSADPTVSVVSTSPEVVVRINTAGSLGATHKARFVYTP
ncbi:polysaccharide lyase 8 family protein [Micromonospora globbae]|uniref:polysaccharide lyase 8 family protein n=1 Tax=Micromonospora globbae TaxID=1894969 RepID=UPI003446CE2C